MVNRDSERTTRAHVDEIQVDYFTLCELGKSLHILKTFVPIAEKFDMLIKGKIVNKVFFK